MSNYDVRLAYSRYLGGYKSKNQYLPRVAILYKSNVMYPDAIVYAFQEGNARLGEELLQELHQEMVRKYKNDKSVDSYFAAFKNFVCDRSSIISVKWSNAKTLRQLLSTCKISPTNPVDGMDCLVNALNGEVNFIKVAIEKSYFFDLDLVIKRHCNIVEYLNSGQKLQEYQYAARQDEYVKLLKSSDRLKTGLPARKTTIEEGGDQGSHSSVKGQLMYFEETDSGNNNQFSCKIFHDGNGNAKVCSIINRYTGIHLGVKTKRKPLKNYIISHIWGRAIDPRYFTNLWNIVLVPSWANHLLDKDADNSKLVALYKYSMQYICHKMYINEIVCKGDTWKNWNDNIPKPDKELLSKYQIDEKVILEILNGIEIQILTIKGDFRTQCFEV